MKSENLHLLKIFDLAQWQLLQDSLANLTGMAIITVDYKGVPITRHSGRQKFCAYVRDNTELSRHCQKCDARGGLEATRLNRPYIYLCHYNIVDAAIPILVDNNYLGAIMVGQVFLPTDEEMHQLEPICVSSNKLKLEKQTKQYNEYYNNIPRMSLSYVNKVVDTLFYFASYIVKESLEKKLALEMCIKGAPAPQSKQKTSALSDYPVSTLDSIKRSIDSAIIDAHIQKDKSSGTVCANKILSPAFRHIAEHKNENHSLKEMAKLCHISPSYFSKLFVRETGEKFSVYWQKSKISWARQLLTETEKSVAEIGADVGFNDSAHFIKTFKRYEGITPARYRSHYALYPEHRLD